MAAKVAVAAKRQEQIEHMMKKMISGHADNEKQIREAFSGYERRTKKAVNVSALESVSTFKESDWTAVLFGLCADAGFIEPLAATLQKLCGGPRLTLRFMDLRKSTRVSAMRAVLEKVKLEMVTMEPFMLLVERRTLKAGERMCPLEVKLIAELITIPNVCLDNCFDRVMTVYRIATNEKYILRLSTPLNFALAKGDAALADHFAASGHKAYFRTFQIQLRPDLPALNMVVCSASAREATPYLMAAHSYVHNDRHITCMLRVGPGGHGLLLLGMFLGDHTHIVMLNDCTLFPLQEGFYHKSLTNKKLTIQTDMTRSAEPPRYKARPKNQCISKEEPKQTEKEMVQRLATATAKHYLKKLLPKLDLEVSRLRKIEAQLKHEEEKQLQWEARIQKEQAIAGIRFNPKPKANSAKKNHRKYKTAELTTQVEPEPDRYTKTNQKQHRSIITDVQLRIQTLSAYSMQSSESAGYKQARDKRHAGRCPRRTLDEVTRCDKQCALQHVNEQALKWGMVASLTEAAALTLGSAA